MFGQEMVLRKSQTEPSGDLLEGIAPKDALRKRAALTVRTGKSHAQTPGSIAGRLPGAWVLGMPGHILS